VCHEISIIFAHTRQVEVGHFQQIMREKLNALCRAYQVDPEEVNRHHALLLAQRFLPGFQIDRGKRRTHSPKKWDDVRLARLWTIYRSVRPKFDTDKAAIIHLARQSEIKSCFPPKSNPKDVLKNAFDGLEGLFSSPVWLPKVYLYADGIRPKARQGWLLLCVGLFSRFEGCPRVLCRAASLAPSV